MTQMLIFISIVSIFCIVAGRISNKIGLPSLLLFIFIGMLFGSDGLFKIDYEDYRLSEQICTIALLFIIFYGGFGINLKQAKPIVGKALMLSSVGVVLTAALTGIFCFLFLGVSLIEGLLIGSVLASTDAASVFSVLRSRKLNLKNGIAPLLEMESASNDPFAYTLTSIILGYMSNQSTGSVFVVLLLQIGLGIIFGAIIGILATWLMGKVKFKEGGIKSILVVAFILLGFALPTMLGGNGFLSVYIIGVILGNYKLKYKVELVHFFDGITQMMQMLLFFLLGLLSLPSQLPKIIFPAFMIAIFLMLVARPLTIVILLKPFKVKMNEMLFISWGGLRGAASIVFAILTVVSPAYTRMDIFHIVFLISLLSVAFQGTLLPWMAKKLDVEDNSIDTMKTFNDYRSMKDFEFIETEIGIDHPWVGKNLSEVVLPQGLLVILILRKGENVFPKGDTFIFAEDSLIMCAPSYYDTSGIQLMEIDITLDHHWIGKRMDEIDTKNRLLIILVKRGKLSIIPNGETTILDGDYIVYGSLDKKDRFKTLELT